MKPFSKWTVEDIEEEFQLTLEPAFQGLQTWLQGASPLTQEEAAPLHQLSQKLALYVRDWNEEELKIYFIALLLNMIDFYGATTRPFMERELSVEYSDGKKLWGSLIFLWRKESILPKNLSSLFTSIKNSLTLPMIRLVNYWLKW